MRILHIAYDYDMASASARLAAEQYVQGHDVFFYSKHGVSRFTPGVSPSSPFMSRLGPMIVNRLDRAVTRLCLRRDANGFFSAGLFGWPLPRSVRAEPWDMVHVHWIASGFCNLRTVLMSLRGRKTLHLHDFWLLLGLVPHAYARRSLNRLGFAVQKLVRRRNHALIARTDPLIAAPSSLALEFASSVLAGTDARVVLSPNLLGKGFHPTPRQGRAGKVGKLTLLQVMSGGDPIAKGMDVIVEALRLLPRAVAVSFELYQVGASVISVCSVNGCIIRTAYPVSSSEMPGIYRAIDYTIVWSVAETFSQAAAESLCCGTPVITHVGLPPSRFCQKPYSLVAESSTAEHLAELLLEAHGRGALDVEGSQYVPELGNGPMHGLGRLS